VEQDSYPAKNSEKSCIRDEIDAQTREYLLRGGRIDVLAAGQRTPRGAVGPVWHMDDLPDVDQ